jgi:hypothetical protein
MPSATIDTGVLAVPPAGATSDEAYHYVETLLNWSKLLNEPWVAIYMSERASEILIDDGLYPLRNALRNLFNANGIVEYDVNTVAQVAERLLQLTPSFETFFKVRDVLLDDISNVVTEPDLLSLHTDPGLISDLARCVVLIAILRNHCRNPVLDHTLIIKPFGNATIVKVKALIHDLEHSRDDLEILPQPPEYLEGSILVCQNFRDLVLNIDEETVWQSAQDDVGLRLAVQIALYKSRLQRGLEPDWENVSSFSLHTEFAAAAKTHCQANPQSLVGKILRSMVETIDSLNMTDTHPLRTGPGGGNPQRMREQDTAWRRDIDYEYHLHYWKCHNDTVEFGSVVVHNDFSIPY